MLSLKASLATAEVSAGVVAKADQYDLHQRLNENVKSNHILYPNL